MVFNVIFVIILMKLKKMFTIKIRLIIIVNTIILLNLSAIIANINNKFINKHDNSSDIYCCLNREINSINDKSIDNITTVADGVNLITDDLTTNVKERLTVVRNAYPSIVARKGVNSKSITARKGVDNITIEEITTENIISIDNNKSQLSHKKNYLNQQRQLSIINDNKIKLINNTNVINLMNNTTIKSSNATIMKKIHLKPTVTIIGIDDDNSLKQIVHGTPTKSPPLGMSNKINYVIPVIITILILPLFIILMIYIYKNGRDCWEKRHYRRMDFLIDGMYNE